MNRLQGYWASLSDGEDWIISVGRTMGIFQVKMGDAQDGEIFVVSSVALRGRGIDFHLFIPSVRQNRTCRIFSKQDVVYCEIISTETWRLMRSKGDGEFWCDEANEATAYIRILNDRPCVINKMDNKIIPISTVIRGPKKWWYLRSNDVNVSTRFSYSKISNRKLKLEIGRRFALTKITALPSSLFNEI